MEDKDKIIEDNIKDDSSSKLKNEDNDESVDSSLEEVASPAEDVEKTIENLFSLSN